LRAIPYGSTVSYAELARRIGRPGASRAVGSANGRNPIAIVVPCHRVIAADGTLGGYGGGLDRKEWLLELEGATRQSAKETHPAERLVATCLAVD
jgi:methylated-DNA-[protein]-cysteine S-methyltransferase